MFMANQWIVILLLTLIPIEAIFVFQTQTPVSLSAEVAETP